MRKLLLVLFLLLISSLGVVGFIAGTDDNNIEVEQQSPLNSETIKLVQ
ncbi:hypothetical protein [Radiobacillus sp. PE A8.2]